MQDIQNEQNQPLNTLLAEISTGLSQLNTCLSGIETQLNILGDRVSNLEQNQNLMADVYRYKQLQSYLAQGNWLRQTKKPSV